MKVGLFFGSFNPIHIGHLIIAQTMLDKSDIEEVWFVVSPQNPLKDSKSLIHHFDRIDMVELAIEDNDRFKASDIEFNLPKPSYTIDTLTYMAEKYSQRKFYLIIGEDNLESFSRWKNHEQILRNHGLLVYYRPGISTEHFKGQDGIQYVEAPLIHLSATYIRQKIQNDESTKYLIPDAVADYIRDKKLYLTS